MVQVLPYVPTFGQSLLPQIAEAGASIGKAIQERNAKAAFEKLLQPSKPQQNAIPGIAGQTGVMPSQQTSGLSPLQQMIQKEGGPNLSDIALTTQLAKKAGFNEKAVADYLLNEQKLSGKRQLESERHERELLAPSNKQFFEKIATDRLRLPEAQLSNEMIIDSIKNGDLDPWSKVHLGKIAEDFGAPQSLVSALETPGTKEYKTARKTFIASTIKDAFKGTTTKTEIQLAEDMIAELGVTKEANLASAWGVQSRLEIEQERVRLADQLIEQGVTPSKVPATVDKMMQPFVKQVKDEYFDALKELRKIHRGE